MALKWGFSSAGRIAHDYLNAMGSINKGDHQVIAISDPNVARAEEIAKQFDIPNFYDDSLKIAQNPDIEIVHVGALNPLHCEIALLMMEHGKHVLCEKPMCMNAKQVRQLIACAKKNNVFLMENLWPRFFPSYQYIRKYIEDGKLGDVMSIDVEFGNAEMGTFERMTRKDLGGGTVLDLGVYTTQFCQWIFREEPKSIKATGKLNEEGVDLEMSTELYYGVNKIAKMRTSATQYYKNEAKITGTRGTMTIPFFWSPISLDVDGIKKDFPSIPKAKHEFIFKRCDGLCYGPDEIRKCIRAGKNECEKVPLNDSLIIARIEDEIRRQIGVKYPADE